MLNSRSIYQLFLLLALIALSLLSCGEARLDKIDVYPNITDIAAYAFI